MIAFSVGYNAAPPSLAWQRVKQMANTIKNTYQSTLVIYSSGNATVADAYMAPIASKNVEKPSGM